MGAKRVSWQLSDMGQCFWTELIIVYKLFIISITNINQLSIYRAVNKCTVHRAHLVWQKFLGHSKTCLTNQEMLCQYTSFMYVLYV